MEQVFSEIVNKSEVPTRADIARLLEACGKPGENHEEKVGIIRRLFDEMGLAGTNPQGYHVADDLTDYEQF